MALEIELVSVERGPVAVIRDHIPLEEVGDRLVPIFDRVYAVLPAAGIETGGRNLLIMRDGLDGYLDVEVGVQVAASFGGFGDLVPSSTPGGEAATAVHWGEYDRLPAVHQAMIQWCDDNGQARTGIRWEIYGHWEDDPAERRTDVFWQLEPS